MLDHTSTKKKRVLFIVNPVSGAGKREDVRRLIQDNLDTRKFTFDYVETEYRNHASELSEKASKEKVDIVVACGGDGTVNEVAKALVHTDTTMGIIPNGSGNGFAMHVGLGRNTKRAIQMINDATPLRIDTCTVNDRFFLNLAGIGFDALIAYKVDHGKKRGLQMYINTVSKEIVKFKAENYTVTTSENKTINGAFSVIAVANAAMYGYNFTIAPKAKLTDGLLDVVFVKEASLARTMINSWRMLNNSIHKSKLVDIIKTKEVQISLDKPYYYHVDGESFKFDSELHFKIVPKSLNVLFPLNSHVLDKQENND